LCALQVLDVDFFDAAPFPTYDVITMGMVLHDWGLQKKKLLMKKVRRGSNMHLLAVTVAATVVPGVPA
jgi:hypothetical protein